MYIVFGIYCVHHNSLDCRNHKISYLIAKSKCESDSFQWEQMNSYHIWCYLWCKNIHGYHGMLVVNSSCGIDIICLYVTRSVKMDQVATK